eukprot:g11501.t1
MGPPNLMLRAPVLGLVSSRAGLGVVALDSESLFAVRKRNVGPNAGFMAAEVRQNSESKKHFPDPEQPLTEDLGFGFQNNTGVPHGQGHSTACSAAHYDMTGQWEGGDGGNNVQGWGAGNHHAANFQYQQQNQQIPAAFTSLGLPDIATGGGDGKAGGAGCEGGGAGCGAAPSKEADATGGPSKSARENTKKKKFEDGEEEDFGEEDEENGAPPPKRRKNENPLFNVPLDEVEPLPGHQQLRITNINMMGVEIHSERLNYIADVAGWRKLDVALLSEFAYKKKTRKAPPRRKKAGRKRRSEQDEESSDEEENLEDPVVEHEDPIAAKGVPTWVLRGRFDMVYINGCGVMIFNKRLRAQAKKIREQNLKHAIRSGPRFIALYLTEVILAATYAPQANAGPDELESYDTSTVELLREMQKRKRDKWKMRIVGGDVNAHVGRDEFADSVVHLGVGGARATNGRGRTFAKVLMATNSVLVSSKFEIEGAGDDDELYHTYVGKAGMGREQKLNERPSSSGKGGITPEKAKKKYDEVGNSPLHPGRDDLPISDELEALVSEFSDEIKKKLDRPVEAKELKRAALHLKAGGKAKDINGLGADILLKLDSGSLEMMTEQCSEGLGGAGGPS